MDENLNKIVSFILETDKLKNIYRQTYVTGENRTENDAEHKAAQITAAEANADQLRGQIAEEEKQIASREETLASVRESLAAAQQAFAQTQAEREALLAQIGEKEAYLAEALAEQKKHADALLDLKVRLNVLKKQLQALQFLLQLKHLP